MKKYLVVFIIFSLVSMLHIQVLFADRDDEANKCYLDAYNLYKLGKMDQSLEMLKKVVEVSPDHAEAHFGMGSIYFRQNMFDDAVKEFTKVTKIKPEYVEAYQRLWLAYKKLGMNDRAEEELLKYKKLIEERMQSMGGGSPQVAKPVAPPPQREERVEASKPEETKVEPYRPPETRPPETTVPETMVAESRPPDVETQTERSPVVKPEVPPQEEYRPPVVAPVPPVIVRPVEPPQPPQEMKSATKLEEYRSPYIKVDKKDPAYKNLFTPFKKMGSTLFQSPQKKSVTVTKLQKTYFGKLIKGFLYYIIIVQIWLGIVASFCIYFLKPKGNKL
ncbi:MAG TPA: tetratricopeptide repeat protein [Candidatus Wunengus sp. YC63]|uniref:tetratricopeptide repeat protein n=1 Tax=unclassified Candidatus Wunengus TaxID=3367695 RepID=UPI004028FFF3